MINKEKSTPRHIVMKWHNTKNEDLKNPREKSQGTYKEQTISYQKTFFFFFKKKEYNNNLLVLTTTFGSSYCYYFYFNVRKFWLRGKAQGPTDIQQQGCSLEMQE